MDGLLSDSRFGLPRGKRGKIAGIDVENVNDSLGVGKRVVLKVAECRGRGFMFPLFAAERD